jgi:hypothetical protein
MTYQKPTDESASPTSTLSRRTLVKSGLTTLLIGGGVGTIPARATATTADATAMLRSDGVSSQPAAVSPPEQFLAPRWSTQFNTRIQTRAEDGALYITQPGTENSQAKIRSFDLQSGDERWSQDLSFSVDFPPFPRTPGSSAVVLVEGTEVASYERSSGVRRWKKQYQTDRNNTRVEISYPTEDIFILAEEGGFGDDGITQNTLVGVDRQTGDTRWERTVDLPGAQINVTLPFFTSDSAGYVMFATAQGHRILRLNPSTGSISERYTITVADQLSKADRLSFARFEQENNFFTISGFGADGGSDLEVMRAFISLEGEPESVISGQNIRELFSVTGTGETKAYAVTTADELRIVALPTNETIGTISTPGEVVEEVSEIGAKLYTSRFTPASAGGFDFEVIARNNQTGEEQWARTIAESIGDDQSRVPFIPVDQLNDDQLVVRSEDGVFISLDRETGEVGQWAVSLSGDSPDIAPGSGGVVGTTTTFSTEGESTIVSIFPTPSQSDTQPAIEPQLNATVQQAGSPDGQARVQYTITDISSQSSVALEFTNLPSQVSVNTSDSTTTGTFGQNNQQVVFLQPSSEVTTTIAFDIAASASADATFDIETAVLNEDSTATGNVTTTVGDIETGPIERFDADGDGDISLTEVQDAIRAFSNGELDLQGVQQVIAAFSS